MSHSAFVWVAVKELELSYQTSDSIVFNIYICINYM